MRDIRKCRQEKRWGKRLGFIGGLVLPFLMVLASLCLCLYSGLSFAISGTREQMDGLRAHLIFEKVILGGSKEILPKGWQIRQQPGEHSQWFFLYLWEEEKERVWKSNGPL